MGSWACSSRLPAGTTIRYQAAIQSFVAAGLWYAITGRRGLMSTAGKVLIVLVILASLGWMALTAGIAQLNKNGNQRLEDLAKNLEKAQADLREAKLQTLSLRASTAVTQEKVDREIELLRARLSALEKAHSQIVENLTRTEYQLAEVEETIKGAQASLENRTAERRDEEQALADLRKEVKELEAEDGRLLAQLQTLRQRFDSTYHSNLEMLGGRQ
jgi:chromosome segregation ATPase